MSVPDGFRPVVRYGRNTVGSDYVVGDIHGHFAKLQTQLDEMGFRPEVDRLFSVGDLVDRGPDSELFEDWLAKPWFHAVRGNHEDMAIDASKRMGVGHHVGNGGAWLQAFPIDHQRYIGRLLSELPFAIEVEVGDRLVGIVHADVPGGDWDHMKAELAKPGMGGMHSQNYCMWSRHRIDYGVDTPVKGIDAVIVGHTVVKLPIRLGNVCFIDTGPAFGGAFTVVRLE